VSNQVRAQAAALAKPDKPASANGGDLFSGIDAYTGAFGQMG
jgi:hypothetical protein